MEIQSKIFGKIDFSDSSIIELEEGLIGISEKKKFILIEKEDFKPFSYLQSVEDGSFSLIVINPLLLVKDYKFNVYREDLDAVGIKSENDILLLSVAVFADKIENITVNLKAPILINIHSKKGKQVILENDDYTMTEPLINTSVLESITQDQGKK